MKKILWLLLVLVFLVSNIGLVFARNAQEDIGLDMSYKRPQNTDIRESSMNRGSRNAQPKGRYNPYNVGVPTNKTTNYNGNLQNDVPSRFNE